MLLMRRKLYTVTRCSVGKHAVKLYRAEDVSPDYIDNKPLYALINLHYDEPVERLANIILDQFLGAVQVEITDCTRSGIIVTKEETNDGAKETDTNLSTQGYMYQLMAR